MVHSLQGVFVEKKDSWFGLSIGGVVLRIKTSANVLNSLPQIGNSVKVFTHLHVREDALEFYGFLDENELFLFEQLIGISGIGPKSAIGILGVEKAEKLRAAISEGRSELLTKASGVGKKTAERIILELRNKMTQEGSEKIVGMMESDHDIVEALHNLGYTKGQAKEALAKIDQKIMRTEERIKEALKLLKNN